MPKVAPLVSLETLRQLAAELEDEERCRSFVRNFICIWDERHARLCQAIQASDAKAAMDVVLSLKVSSAMAGAGRLSQLAANLQAMLLRLGEDIRTSCTLSLLEEITACGRATMAQLRLDYLEAKAERQRN
ncbi:Hpt domain-containing protein [Crystallibacter degradans]|uniref:Hpt domain-containing protein n=1 Tax=Crystallibacter degradans TaxID=2726743 RepID=UPI001473FAE9|nr:Hpt domain-containing protein [Arthrobacter sp. SF27]NMR30393.1 Hpt domain-containing protein [Arthrobacter sp. SF27]